MYIVYRVQKVFKYLKIDDTDTHYHHDPFVDVTEPLTIEVDLLTNALYGQGISYF